MPQHHARPLPGARRQPHGQRSGHQVGFPQARQEAPPGPEPERPEGEGALRRDQLGLRDRRRQGQAQAVRRRRHRRRRQAALPGAAGRRVRRLRGIWQAPSASAGAGAGPGGQTFRWSSSSAGPGGGDAFSADDILSEFFGGLGGGRAKAHQPKRGARRRRDGDGGGDAGATRQRREGARRPADRPHAGSVRAGRRAPRADHPPQGPGQARRAGGRRATRW